MSAAESPWLTPGEVAKLFRVHSKTVSKWADKGILTSMRTPGGQRRYSRAEIQALLTTAVLTGSDS